MRIKRSRVIGIGSVALLAAGVACWSVAMCFEFRKHERSGVPWDHFARDTDGRKIYVPGAEAPSNSAPRFR